MHKCICRTLPLFVLWVRQSQTWIKEGDGSTDLCDDTCVIELKAILLLYNTIGPYYRGVYPPQDLWRKFPPPISSAIALLCS